MRRRDAIRLASSFESALMHFARDEVGSNGHARQTDDARRDPRDRLRRRRHRVGADLSQSADQDRGRIRAGRSGRRDGGSDRTTPDLDSRARRPHRQSAGGREHHRRARCRGIRPRRLHAAPRQYQHAISPLIYKNVNYDPVRGFAPIAALGTTSNLLIVNPALPVKSVQELVALARANPGKLNYASAGIGTPPHLIGEMFKQRLNLDVVHVPYKGGGPSVAATVAGETQFSFENPASSLPLVEAGRVRALASTSDRRSSQMPDVPTMIEAGIADFTSVSFTGVVAPAGTPGAIVDRLNAAINAGLQSPEIASTLVKLGVDAKISSPPEFAAFLARERDKW